MKHRNIRKGVSKYIREHLDELIDNDTDLKPRTLDYILSARNDYAEEFHWFYVQLLLESGLTLEESLPLLAEGALRPN
jgi:hypothetical protein